jgi:hypothetical protein
MPVDNFMARPLLKAWCNQSENKKQKIKTKNSGGTHYDNVKMESRTQPGLPILGC